MKHILAFLAGSILALEASAQTDVSNLRTVMPPSPNASSIAKYGSWPVSLYTGIPNIHIPLCELKGRSISIPVSLSYHSAGNSVGEIASWVGLGWSLQAGGLITRTVRGLPDDYGYWQVAPHFTNPDDLSSPALSQTTLEQDIVASAKGNTDTQEDMYTLNAMGKTYKLLLKADGTAMTIPYSNVKVVSNPMVGNSNATTNQSWTVLLEDGTKLVFGNGSGFIEYTNNPSGVTGDGGGVQYVSTWYLNTITSPVGETVSLTYTASPTTLDQASFFGESDNLQYLTSGDGGCGTWVDGAVVSSGQVMQVSALNLSSISNDVGRIEFITNSAERQDLKGGNALSEIRLYSKLAGKYTEDYLFYTSYAAAVTSNEIGASTAYEKNRLHLDSVVRKDVSSIPGPAQKWYFDYNTQHLPSRRSYAQDHWGFFNGATSNTTFLPYVYYQVPTFALPSGMTQVTRGFMPSVHPIGANRSANAAYMQAEMLTKIHYPTGGTSSFTYEPNTYSATEEVLNPTTTTLNLPLYYTSHPTNTVSTNFTITQPQYISLSMTSNISSAILTDQPNARVSVVILNSSGTAVASTSAVNGSQSGYFDLRSAGTYTLSIAANVDTSSFANGSDYIVASVSMGYRPSLGTLAHQRFAGGLRIKSISDNDGILSSGTNTRFFQYDQPLVINPTDSLNDYLTTLYVDTYGENTLYGTTSNTSICDYTKIVRNSTTRSSLGSIEGGTIGYGQVTTLFGTGGVNGTTVSIFNNEPDGHLSDASLYPYPNSEARGPRRGLLLEERTYDAGSHLLKKLSNSYSFDKMGSVIGFKAGFQTTYSTQLCSDPYGNCGITRMYLYTTAEKVKHLTSGEVNYNALTGDSAATQVNYYYDDSVNSQPIRTVSVNSQGDTVLSYARTALEKVAINSSMTLSATASTAIDTMLARNMVGMPVQSEKYVQAAVVSKALTNYKLQASGLVLPDNIYSQHASYSPEMRVLFSRYDGYGNLLEQKNANDVRHVYLWDYRNTYPVAEVLGGDSLSAYTSFEADGTGGWVIAGSARDSSAPAITGYKCYLLANGTISRSGLTSSNIYIVSYWSKNGSCSVSGSTSLLTGKTINLGTTAWTYYEHVVTGVSTITISGSASIDELRLYLNGAQMTTFTYDPFIGVTSGCDVANRVTYYQYDGFNRLYAVKDQDGNVIRKYCYSYNGATNACTQFYSAAKSGSFTRSTCATGGTPSTVTYSVPAGKYYSLISQAVADSLAQADITTNGLAYANANGTCTFYNVAKSGTFTRTNCGANYVGGSVTYTVAANTYSSMVSQAAADSLAQAAVTANGPAYANANGTCTPVYTITSTNYTALSGFYVQFTNTSTAAVTTFSIPAAGGTLGTLPAGTYTIYMAKTSNSSTKYIYTVCTTTKAAAVTATFSSMTISSSCNSVSVDAQ